MVALLLVLACGHDDRRERMSPAAAFEYTEGMWQQRAMTVRAGLDEAAALQSGGSRGRAAEAVMLVYEGSFEPELEVLIRREVDARTATELEYRFGLLRATMLDGKTAEVLEQQGALLEQLDRAAARLDEAQAVL